MKKIIPVLVAIVLIFVIGAVAFGGKILERYSYSKERADLDTYFGVSDEKEIAIILQDDLIEEKARLIGNTVYFDFPTVEKYFTDRFYVSEEEKLLLFTTADDVIRIQIGDESDVIYVSDIGNSLDYKAALYEGETLYIAADYVKKYVNLSYSLYGEPLHMQVYTQWGMVNEAKIIDDTSVRIKGGIKSEILVDVSEGDKVIVLEEMETWTKVKTSTGFIGYVENKKLGSVTQVEQDPVTGALEVVINSIQKEDMVSMVFQQVFNADANSKPSKLLKNSKGVNVISPTWFRLCDNEGNFTSIASKDYVTDAHNMGVEVWALITDVDTKSMYDVVLDYSELLGSSVNRERLIDGLMAQVEAYDLDGINIDLELVKDNAGTHFIQFLRELSIETRKRGIVLSVDNYVPSAGKAHYNLKEQGLVVDYVIIMGYDEHYLGGGIAGSNASIDFVERGIVNTKKHVPAEKVINALPLFTKVWKSSLDGLDVATLSMVNQEEWVSKSGVTPLWLEEFCQNYVEYESDGVMHQCWLEDEESIKVKLQVMKAQQVAGVAAWKLGFEDKNIWEVISQYVDGSM